MNERRSPLLAFTAFEQALLRSADADEAPRGAAERAVVALGVGTNLSAISTNAAGATAPVPSASPAWSLWQKPLLIGVLGGVSVALSARVIDAPPERSEPKTSSTSPRVAEISPAPSLTATPQRTVASRTFAVPLRPKQTPVSSSSAVAPGPAAASAAPTASSTLTLMPPAPLPTLDSAPSTTPGDSATHADPVAAAAHSPSIAAEVIVVDRARAALREGRVAEALAELARYREQWPLGVLTPEVTVLQIEAELKSGAREAARRRAKALVAAQPNSRYAARLRMLFDAKELQ